MNRLRSTLLLIPQLVLLALPSSGRALEHHPDSSETEIHGNVHAAAGLTSGGRLGIGLQVHSILIEAAYGAVLQNFIGLTDPDNRLTFGVNWKPNEHANLAYGLLLVTRVRPGLGFPKEYFDDLYFSFTVGSLPFHKKGFGVFIRGGLTFGYIRDPASIEKNFSFWGPNVDAGVFWAPF